VLDSTPTWKALGFGSFFEPFSDVMKVVGMERCSACAEGGSF